MNPRFSRKEILVSTLAVEGVLAFLAVILAGLCGLLGLRHQPVAEWQWPWTALHWSWAAVGWGCLGAVPPLVIILLIDRYPIGPFKHVADISDRFLRPLLRPCRWPDYFLLATLAGFCEELFFRGWMQPCLAQWLPLWAGVLLSGFVFALCHLITPAYFIIAWIISLYLAALLIWTDNLLVPMLTHGVYDLIAIFAVMNTKTSTPDEPDRISARSDEIIETLPTPLSAESDSSPQAPSPSSTDREPGNDA